MRRRRFTHWSGRLLFRGTSSAGDGIEVEIGIVRAKGNLFTKKLTIPVSRRTRRNFSRE